MKVTVANIPDFVDEVRHAEGVYQEAVRFHIQKQALQDEAITFDIVVDVTAVLLHRDKASGEETDYLVECVIPCGIEPGMTGEVGGLKQATDLRIQLINALMPLNIKVRPGRLEA